MAKNENFIPPANDKLFANERLELALEASGDGIWDYNFVTEKNIASKRMKEILGFDMSQPNADFYLNDWAERLHPDSQESTMKVFQKVLDNESDIYVVEQRVRCNDGNYKWLLTRGKVISRDEDGQPLRMIGTASDLTEQKKTEEDMKLAQFVMANAPINITLLDSEARICYVNKSACETLGYTKNELLKMNILDIDPHFSREAWEEAWINLRESQSFTLETVHQRKNGERFPIDVVANYLEFGEKAYNVAFDRDISERKKLEQQLWQAQKLESLGTLVGGIAHDFNNMLAAINGNAYLAMSRAQGNKELMDNIESIDKVSMRAAEMIKQMLTFARKDQVEMQTFSLTQFLKEAVKLAATALPERISKNHVAPTNELYVYGDPTQLQQVLMNLFNNAKDALEEVKDGKVTCILEAYTADTNFRLRHPSCMESHFACLTVSDNGHGIPENIMTKIFDPFFTTKGVGKGTGLGLAMVFGAIEGHGGAIEVESTPEKETSFNIYLPLVKPTADDVTAAPQQVKKGHNELILVADDEDLVREMYEAILPTIGYRVIAARNGEEAVSLFTQNRDDICLAILDVVMPLLGGIDVAKKIKQLNENLPIIFATGYDKGALIEDEKALSAHKVINKPFSVQSLSESISQELGDSAVL